MSQRRFFKMIGGKEFNFISRWHNKARAVMEAKWYRRHGIKARVFKERGHGTAWECWVCREDLVKADKQAMRKDMPPH